jgi:peptidoglycan hydrolase-like protein with peptidoglycan-binding domain
MKTLVLGCFLVWTATALADDLTRAVQERLKERGFYYGGVDGQSGSETSAAIRRYQIRYGLKVNGELTEETLKSLGLSANNLSAAPSASPNAPEVNRPNNQGYATPPPTRHNPSEDDEQYVDPRNYPPYTQPTPSQVATNYRMLYAGSLYARAPDQVQQSVMQAVQNQLARWGFYRGNIDGQPSPETVRAIRDFQEESGFWPSGRLDNWTLQALRALPGQRNGPPVRRAPAGGRFGPSPYFRETEPEQWVD